MKVDIDTLLSFTLKELGTAFILLSFSTKGEKEVDLSELDNLKLFSEKNDEKDN